jgi:glycosyltransferase involved in cell wall biosynthesis
MRVGFDLSSFVVEGRERVERRSVLRARLGVPPDARVVTFVGRLVAIKRVDRFLRIASRLRNEPGIRFLIVGDGELRDELRVLEEARTLADRVIWTGFRRDMPDIYAASDVVVQTSDNEGTPVALVEAQAAGVPVVSTRVGGVSSVVLNGESGRILPPDDEAGFAEAVRELLVGGDVARDMGARGRQHVTAAFSLERLLEDIDGLYRRLLDRTGVSLARTQGRWPTSAAN